MKKAKQMPTVSVREKFEKMMLKRMAEFCEFWDIEISERDYLQAIDNGFSLHLVTSERRHDDKDTSLELWKECWVYFTMIGLVTEYATGNQQALRNLAQRSAQQTKDYDMDYIR